MDRPRLVYLRVLVMLKREGWVVGKKRVYRLYRLKGLQLRMKVKRRKRISLQRGRPTPATGAERALEHGLRPRPDARWPGIPRAHGDRSVESRERVTDGPFRGKDCQ